MFYGAPFVLLLTLFAYFSTTCFQFCYHSNTTVLFIMCFIMKKFWCICASCLRRSNFSSFLFFHLFTVQLIFASIYILTSVLLIISWHSVFHFIGRKVTAILKVIQKLVLVVKLLMLKPKIGKVKIPVRKLVFNMHLNPCGADPLTCGNFL